MQARKTSTLVLIVALLLPLWSNAQQRCNTDELMEKIYQENPDYRLELEKGRQEFSDAWDSNSSLYKTNSVVTIPVHVVIVHPPGQAIGTGVNFSEAKVQSQIDVLNEDFRRTNSDAGNTPSVFPTGDTGIEFCLASVDPNGNATNGITRYGTNQNFESSESAIKGATKWDRNKYLNIYSAPTIDGLGFAYLPTTTTLPNATKDGVAILSSAFGGPGTGASAPFNRGRTATHEVGHYLGLEHIWGSGCNQDDGISDTPNQSAENYGCPSHPKSSCSSADMFMNYMDYVDDNCMNAFSLGQGAYMQQILATSRASLVAHAAIACGVVTPPTANCNDGLQNGNETGVDCGGSCAPCPTVANCNDGLQNGNETGVDCGGSCSPCAPVANCNDGLQNGNETGVDCGGSCAPCQPVANCNDGQQNGNETGVDCGGSCAPCNTGNDYCAPAVDPYNGAALTDADCIAEVQENDTYCCDVDWDGICQDAYEDCTGATGPTCVHPNPYTIWTSWTKARIGWSYITNADKYRVRYKPVSGGSWKYKNTYLRATQLNGLFNNREYKYNVRSLCYGYGWTDWSPTGYFETGSGQNRTDLGRLEGAGFEMDSNVGPNPTAGPLNVEVLNLFQREITATVYDVSGKVVLQSQTLANEGERMNLSELRNGVYLLVLSDGVTKMTHKVIKF